MLKTKIAILFLEIYSVMKINIQIIFKSKSIKSYLKVCKKFNNEKP